MGYLPLGAFNQYQYSLSELHRPVMLFMNKQDSGNQLLSAENRTLGINHDDSRVRNTQQPKDTHH